MPLYLDFHKLGSEEILLEDLVKAHAEDVAIQEDFGVFEKKYWVNIEAKTLFCLTEAPNKEACNEVHRRSHGNTACNIIEVSEEEFSMYLGIGTSENDMAHTLSGELDTGYRTLLMISTYDFTGNYKDYSDKIHGLLKKHNGVIVLQPKDDIQVSFISALDAVNCAVSIFELLKAIPDDYLYKVALVTGKPVDEFGTDMYEDAKKKLHHLNKIGSENAIYIDTETKALSEKESSSAKMNNKNIKVLNEKNFSFLDTLFKILNRELYKSDFKSDQLYTPLGLSKSQAYRTIKSLTGMAPNKLIQELRLHQSLDMLKTNVKTVSEIAYDLGFNSPTYFTRVFRKRFGILPTTFSNNSIE
ncbi:AraC-like DNA-binding protein [Saonia flava]|uniref:AraC-like DNA-binding protein n=1 Tax=Saonia flava TaxID=523696 RepID=A0A846QMM9_9FLAO|nr:nickel-binding protein [Saonia flava]NJB70256.1 AraC-like DNA-binding protein [Saonia flava]